MESSLGHAKFFAEKLDRALRQQGNSFAFDDPSLPPILAETLTSWLHRPQELPAEHGFEVGSDMRLENQGNVATMSGQDSDSAEVREHLAAHKLVSRISLVWNENVSFTLSAKKTLSCINFKKFCSDSMKESKSECGEDIRAYYQAIFLIGISALAELWDAVNTIPEEL